LVNNLVLTHATNLSFHEGEVILLASFPFDGQLMFSHCRRPTMLKDDLLPSNFQGGRPDAIFTSAAARSSLLFLTAFQFVAPKPKQSTNPKP